MQVPDNRVAAADIPAEAAGIPVASEDSREVASAQEDIPVAGLDILAAADTRAPEAYRDTDRREAYPAAWDSLAVDNRAVEVVA